MADPRPTGGTLRLILGDQLHPHAPHRPHPLLADLDPALDRVWMAEADGEARHVWSHKARIALFLAAMRHFAATLREAGVPLDYHRLGRYPTLEAALADTLARQGGGIARVAVLEPGDRRVLSALAAACRQAGVALEVRPDPHFFCTGDDFSAWAGDKPQLRMEFFYRWMRRRHGVLMTTAGAPAGDRWNFDGDNRDAFPPDGPGPLPPVPRFAQDGTTRDVLDEVAAAFADHPGGLEGFAWPVTPAQARALLERFIADRLPHFGRYQDAMWQGEPVLWHSLLAATLNLKLLDPREVVAAAETAWREGRVPLAAAEGFIRQILGWREFVRGMYMRESRRRGDAGFAHSNHLGAERPLPAWFWTGQTQANCLAQTIRQTLALGYAHHIQRLMMTGNFALLAGLSPRAVADWYLAAYVDAVAWVEEPNTLGMALFALGPVMTSKPYCASGAYLKRMSNYCAGCRYRPDQAHGPRACPFTALYWHFLDRNEDRLGGNPRLALAYRNLARRSPEERAALRAAGEAMLARLDDL